MKRYKIVQNGMSCFLIDAETECNFTHSFEGKYLVQYEPWMEQDKNAEYFTIPLKNDEMLCIRNPQTILTGNDLVMSAGIEPKQPTICVECKNIQVNQVCCNKISSIDFVTGEEKYTYCRDKNHGNCPDFEAKDS